MRLDGVDDARALFHDDSDNLHRAERDEYLQRVPQQYALRSVDGSVRMLHRLRDWHMRD
jgi:hypothetical protein